MERRPSIPSGPFSRGFTLIELLIVVAVIAILAAIAVPNFLEAQTRAKVGRSLNDLRALATAVEIYRIDHNAYPTYGRLGPDGMFQYPATVNSMYDRMCFIGPLITTPLAYVDRIPADVFASRLEGPPVIHQVEYLNLDQHVANFPVPRPPFAPFLIPAWGHWRMVTAGPDRDRGLDIKQNRVYDPSNGTISDGDIVRCQRLTGSQINPLAP